MQEHQDKEIKLEGDTYEVLRGRLLKHIDDLQKRLGNLNKARKEVFGSIETSLLSTERITTGNNCVSRDMIPIGNSFILGYNVHIGLRMETNIADVFSIYKYENHQFHAQDLTLVNDARFEEDFKNLYKYYKQTEFVKFARVGTFLYMVFRIGKSVNDIKVFKWAINEDKLVYVDARSEHEFKYPEQHQFEWKRVTRDMQRDGANAHFSIEDLVFVETIGGDLTIKVEDNTDTGQGIYSEPVEQADQTLDDAEIHYAILGNIILLKVKPYQERDFRYIVFNSKIQEARRIDAIENACVLLPDDHGLIFPDGYYLQTGEFKLFDHDLKDLLYERRLLSPNGEDYLYVFFNRAEGIYLLLSYNLIEQTVDTPVICSGYSIFENGEMCYFKSDGEPKKHHIVQIWQTPYVGPDYEIQSVKDDFLYKIGNKDIVRAMAGCHEIMYLMHKGEGYAGLYLEIMKKSSDLLDTYYWLDKEETYELQIPILAIKETASLAIDEYEKVRNIKSSTRQQLNLVKQKKEDLTKQIGRQKPKSVNEFVKYLADLRILRGETISLKELRYINLESVESLEAEIEAINDEMARDCVKYLVKKESLNPYEQRVRDIEASIDGLKKVVDANKVEEQIDQTSLELEMLIEIVSNLKIEDATQTTQIIDHISAIYSSFNQIKVALKRKRKDLLAVEGTAEFNAQIKLISQGLINYLDMVTTPEKCDEFLAKLMVQLEELEGKFAEFDDFIEKISLKREEIYSAFESKKVALLEARNKRANTLQASADRIIKASQGRASKFDSVNEINGYFAADIMIEKARNIIDELIEMGDTVKADDIQSRLKTVKEEAIRQLKDKSELFVDGENTIKLGNYSFLVNTQALQLTIVNKDDDLYFHLTGTNFFELIRDQKMNDYQRFWDRPLVSESKEVYRAEYLAYKFWHYINNAKSDTRQKGEEIALMSLEHIQEQVSEFMAQRFDEGYVKGVHDYDASLIFSKLNAMVHGTDLLRFSSSARAMAAYFWQVWLDEDLQADLEKRLKGAGMILKVFPKTKEFHGLKLELVQAISNFQKESGLFSDELVEEAGAYLFIEKSRGDHFIIDGEAEVLYKGFLEFLKKSKSHSGFRTSVDGLNKSAAFKLILSWLHAYEEQQEQTFKPYLEEAALLILNENYVANHVLRTSLKSKISDLRGAHSSIKEQQFNFDLNEFMLRLHHFDSYEVPAYRDYTIYKKKLAEQFSDELRLGEFKPQVMNSFVRNELINKVYLSLIGANLAKQIGAAGEGKRTDLMGMLLLVSPPGYGKTTLMEYVANRLGLIFMKINGPAIGHEVTSVDPAQATNASSREELEKLNLAFEMGDNVMIYVDDIQHTNPEFLQKFISLCDAQRKIEGVYKGRSKTYDFKGKKVCVVMAGNPYTESGARFQIPDMLANRADIYNLGDIIGDQADVFKLSYIQNCATSNAVLSQLAGKSQKDVLTLIKVAETGNRDELSFEANHAVEEINEYVSVLGKILKVRDVVLKVNEQYILSAGQAEEYRTEPAFKLQGSYRNMNKIAEKIVPVMNDAELDVLIDSHYENEAQTLTKGAEANLLKFKEMIGALSDEDAERWEQIRQTFQRNNKLKGLGGNEMGHVLAQMESITEGLFGIKQALSPTVGDNVPAKVNTLPAKEQVAPQAAVTNSGNDWKQYGDRLDEVLRALADNQSKIITELRLQQKTDRALLDAENERERLAKEEQKRQQELVAKAKKKKEEEVRQMREQVEVAVMEKGFLEEDGNAYITFKFAFQSKVEEVITAFTGMLEFKDQFESPIHSINISYEDGIQPNELITWPAQIFYNQFLEKDIALRELNLEQLRVTWVPQKVMLGKQASK